MEKGCIARRSPPFLSPVSCLLLPYVFNGFFFAAGNRTLFRINR